VIPVDWIFSKSNDSRTLWLISKAVNHCMDMHDIFVYACVYYNFVMMLFRPTSFFNLCKKCPWSYIFVFLTFQLQNINILHSTPNDHDDLCFKLILLNRLDQSSFRRIWSPWLILLTTILYCLHLYCLMYCILCFE